MMRVAWDMGKGASHGLLHTRNDTAVARYKHSFAGSIITTILAPVVNHPFRWLQRACWMWVARSVVCAWGLCSSRSKLFHSHLNELGAATRMISTDLCSCSGRIMTLFVSHRFWVFLANSSRSLAKWDKPKIHSCSSLNQRSWTCDLSLYLIRYLGSELSCFWGVGTTFVRCNCVVMRWHS